VAQHKSLKQVFHFDAQGTLPRPGPFGRLLRLALGIALAKFVYDWLVWVDSSDYANPYLLFWIVFSVALVPYVVNIGFGIKAGARPRYALIGVWLLAGLAGFFIEGKPDSETLWRIVEITQVYIYGHLGISFVLSAVLATPGCEMRAIPQLLGKVSGRGSREHYCPGFIDGLDRWERKRAAGGRGDA
jgi:ABC-type thiamin/hydroxymethylpyrimidine transport system permease subunit